MDKPNTSATDLHTLLPHRPPMLLLEEAVEVSAETASALVTITAESLFFMPGFGVPTWAGLEYMGQTAALMAGFAQQQGNLAPHTGFLLGSRTFDALQPWLNTGNRYLVRCQQDTLVGESLASFQCEISDLGNVSGDNEFDGNSAEQSIVATAILTVFRQPITPIKSAQQVDP